MDIAEKVVVITGAGSGIGKALAVQLAEEGASLALVDYNRTNLEELADVLPSGNQTFSYHLTDISDPERTQRMVEEVVEQHGGVDILINNAGVALGRMEFEDIGLESWEWIMKVNFWGQIYCTRLFLPYLRQKQGGHLINIGSIYSFVAAKNRAAYVASKFALRGFSEALRQELKNSSVALTIVIPGMVSTNITRNGRGWKCPDQQARAAYVLKTKAPTSPEQAARKIRSTLGSRKKLLLIGPDSKLLYWLGRLLPNHYDRIVNFFATRLERSLGRKMKSGQQNVPATLSVQKEAVQSAQFQTDRP